MRSTGGVWLWFGMQLKACDDPGSRGRQLQVQPTAALLRWGIDSECLPSSWAQLLGFAVYVFPKRDEQVITTTIDNCSYGESEGTAGRATRRFPVGVVPGRGCCDCCPATTGPRPGSFSRHHEPTACHRCDGEKPILYSCRQGYDHRVHIISELPPKVVDDAFAKTARRLEAGAPADVAAVVAILIPSGQFG